MMLLILSNSLLKVTVTESLTKAAPNGVDCYFDNVGGQMSIDVMSAMNMFGRLVL